MPSDDLSSNSQKNQELGDLISLSEASEISGLSAGHLRLLVSRGELWGKKIGRNWLTSRVALNEYTVQGHKPGPKPREKI
jgi:hypothetical protein